MLQSALFKLVHGGETQLLLPFHFGPPSFVLRQKQLAFFFLKFFFVLVLIARLQGQSGQVSGTIRGLISDPSGSSVTGAVVKAVNLETGFERRATSGSDGTYEVPLLPIGTYQVIVNAAGFAPFEQSGVSVRLDNASMVNASLRVGSSQQTVTVQEDASILNTQTFDGFCCEVEK